MADMRDVTWRFINVAPIMAGQSALDDLFAETLYPFGIDRFDCIRMSTTSEVEKAGFVSDRGLADWNQYFLDQRYHESDPCLLSGVEFNGAYTWSDVKAKVPDKSHTQMWADARAGGMREGLIVPLTPRKLAGSVVRLITPEPGFDPDVLPLLQSISVVYAVSTQSFTASQPAISQDYRPPVALTDREVECLHWCARGKTNPEIGIILAISRHTVNSHIESAKRKLGVATRVQAVAIAHRLRLVSIA